MKRTRSHIVALAAVAAEPQKGSIMNTPSLTRRLLIALGAFVLTACGSNTTAPDGAAAGQIAFTSDRDGSSQIYLMSADGSGVTRLTNSPAFKERLVWSPDGSKIAFFNFTGTGPDAEIYTINADGSGLRNLTNNPASDDAPAWRPRGP